MHLYQEKSEYGQIKNIHTDRIIEQFFRYADLIINGVIHAYKFWVYAEMDDLKQEARMALIISINKQQWDAEKGNIFNFFTTVVSRNLINYTRKRYKKEEKDIDIDLLYNNISMKYTQDFDKTFIMNDIFSELRKFFKGKHKFIELTKLLEHYYYDNLGKKFVKKHFIEFAKAYNFSPAITNTFFASIKKMNYLKDEGVKELLNFSSEWE